MQHTKSYSYHSYCTMDKYIETDHNVMEIKQWSIWCDTIVLLVNTMKIPRSVSLFNFSLIYICRGELWTITPFLLGRLHPHQHRQNRHLLPRAHQHQQTKEVKEQETWPIVNLIITTYKLSFWSTKKVGWNDGLTWQLLMLVLSQQQTTHALLSMLEESWKKIFH